MKASSIAILHTIRKRSDENLIRLFAFFQKPLLKNDEFTLTWNIFRENIIQCNKVQCDDFTKFLRQNAMVRANFGNFYTVKTLSFPSRKFLMKRCIRNWSFFSSFEWNMWALKFMGVSEYPKAKEVVVVLCTSTYIGPNINNP